MFDALRALSAAILYLVNVILISISSMRLGFCAGFVL